MLECEAYWLGFLLADGHLRAIDPKRSKTTRRISLEIKVSDKSHIDKFLATFASSRTANTRIKWVKGKAYRSALTTISCNKLPFLDYDLFDAFKIGDPAILDSLDDVEFLWCIRGFTDGDGSLGYRKINKNRRKTPVINLISPHESILDRIKHRLHHIVDCPINTNKKSRSIFRVDWSGKHARNLMTALYSNASVYLDRKRTIYLKCINYVSFFERAA